MASEKLAISFESALARDVRDDADQTASGNVSAWLADAAREKLRQRKLDEAVQDYEDEYGSFGDGELDEAARELWPG